MEWRCLDYFRVISRRWKGTTIAQVVVYLGDGPMTMASRIDESELHFGFQVLNLQEVEAQFFLESENDGERMLAMLCRSEDPRVTIAAILASWKHLPVKELAARLGELLVLSQLRNRGTMVEEEVKAMPVDLDITENQLFIMGARWGAAKTLIRCWTTVSDPSRRRFRNASGQQTSQR